MKLTVIGAIAALLFAGGASGATDRSAGTLEIDATFRNYWRIDRSACPPGTPVVADCLRVDGEADIRGLGHATVTYRKVLPNEDENCFMVQNNTAVIEVAGKGTLELFRPGRICVGPPPRTDGPYTFSITDGTGKYAGASGSLSEKTIIPAGDAACRCGTAVDTFTGTLTVPGLDFDLTPPAIIGAKSRTARAPKGAKKVRVRFVVSATDAVDGKVAVSCKPRSGSFFKRGRTAVRCSATDTSANTTRARFTVTVK
jgi:hypothetical protein